MQLIKSGATEPIPVFVTDSTGAPVVGVVAASFTATVRLPNTNAYVAASGSMTVLGNGIVEYLPFASETTISGSRNILLVHVVVSATSTSFGDSQAQIVAFDPTDAAALGLSRIDQTVGSRSTFAGGAVASVTGAVGSVAGNIGGSVAGSVASITNTVTLSTADEAILAKLTAMTNGTPAFTAPALALAPTGGSAPTVTAIRQEIDANSTQMIGIKAKTDLLATNSADSPNAVTAQTASASASTQATSANTRIGIAGAGLTALGDTRVANLDAAVSSRSTFAGGAVASVTNPVTLGTNEDATLTSLRTMISGNVFTAPALALAPTGGSALTAAAIRTEIDANSTQLALIAAKTSALSATPAADVVAATFAHLVETGVTFNQILEAMGAVLAGKYNPSTAMFEAVGNIGTDRVHIAIAGDGTRTLTLTL